MKENKGYLILGMFFLFIQIVAIARNIFSDYYNFFWFCDFAALPLAIGFFLKKDNLIKSIINIGLLSQWIFLALYVYKIFSGISLLDTIPAATTLFYALSSIFIHLSTTFALIFTYKVKPTINTLFSSLMFLFGMYVIALFFTTPEQRINYVLSSRTLTSVIIPHYTELWTLLAFLIVILPTQLIQYLIYKSHMRKFTTV
jgi:hypothetical protein